MEIQVIEPFNMEPAQLDKFLAIGWYRMQQTIFTTDVLHFNNKAYFPIWLRIRLHDIPGKKYLALKKKNKRFTTEIKKAVITPQHEALYARYKEAITFDCAANLHSLLYGKSARDIYNTHMINMYDENKLTGVGFFDLGGNSAAGITSVYDPDYKKYSPGIFMIYEKMIWCNEQNYTWFYPGYFVPGYPLFDYKLDIGGDALEYFNLYTKEWFKPSLDV